MVKVSELLEMPKQLRKNPSKISLNYNSQNRQVERLGLVEKKSEDVVRSVPISRSSERNGNRPPVIPKSAEHHLNKAKAYLINHIPQYNYKVGGLHSSGSDNEDASTRVSSKS